MAPAPTVAFILQVKITIEPSNRDAFLAALKPAADAAMAEPEYAYFLIGENNQEPGVFRLTEGWTNDVAWFMTVQIKKDCYEPYLRVTEPMFMKERIAEVYTAVGGMQHVQLNLMR